MNEVRIMCFRSVNTKIEWVLRRNRYVKGVGYVIIPKYLHVRGVLSALGFCVIHAWDCA